MRGVWFGRSFQRKSGRRRQTRGDSHRGRRLPQTTNFSFAEPSNQLTQLLVVELSTSAAVTSSRLADIGTSQPSPPTRVGHLATDLHRFVPPCRVQGGRDVFGADVGFRKALPIHDLSGAARRGDPGRPSPEVSPVQKEPNLAPLAIPSGLGVGFHALGMGLDTSGDANRCPQSRPSSVIGPIQPPQRSGQGRLEGLPAAAPFEPFRDLAELHLAFGPVLPPVPPKMR